MTQTMRDGADGSLAETLAGTYRSLTAGVLLPLHADARLPRDRGDDRGSRAVVVRVLSAGSSEGPPPHGKSLLVAAADRDLGRCLEDAVPSQDVWSVAGGAVHGG